MTSQIVDARQISGARRRKIVINPSRVVAGFLGNDDADEPGCGSNGEPLEDSLVACGRADAVRDAVEGGEEEAEEADGEENDVGVDVDVTVLIDRVALLVIDPITLDSAVPVDIVEECSAVDEASTVTDPDVDIDLVTDET
jgi:hypothetical protein